MACDAVKNLRPVTGQSALTKGARAEAHLERKGVERGHFARRHLRRCGVEGRVQLFNRRGPRGG
jgi:hypothetical protein